MTTVKMSPGLKWAGGKTQLLDQLTSKMPKTYNRYFEPFIGGGALWLSVAPPNAFINDTNKQLMNLYSQLKINPDGIIDTINKLDRNACDSEYYYQVRSKYNEKIAENLLDAECAGMMIWINKHCFNGLYRVNGKGLFNVPYNNKTNITSFDENNIYTIADYLQNSDTSITCMDFETICSDVKTGDFVYFDSPYVPASSTADFTDYTKDGFSEQDHRRLAALFRDLDQRGALIMLSNNNVPFVHELYDGYNISEISVKRMINSNATKRTGEEVIITNY